MVSRDAERDWGAWRRGGAGSRDPGSVWGDVIPTKVWKGAGEK
ncbi:MAG: hypothetical protein ABSG35_03040 [Syntrophobacteraceae bacterium]|jgi:hypothetical protein